MNHLTTVFRGLHENKTPLILPNAWDAGSARLFESLGAPAIATTSAGVAWALGYSDGDKLPPEKLAALAANIVRVIKVPLSVDVEGGYSHDPSKAAENVKLVLDAGVAGINIEDSTNPFDLLLRKIEKIRALSLGLAIDLFINVRTDVYLQALVPADQQVEETIRRGKAVKEAGADGLFIPALADVNAIKTIVPELDMPVNLMAWPGLPAAAELGKLGVKRLSAGSGIPQIIWNNAATLAENFLKTGDSAPLMTGYMDHSRLQGLFS